MDLFKLVLNSSGELNLSGENKKEKIDDEKMFFISEALKLNTSLKKIILWDNKIGDDGITYLSESLKLNCSLKEIILSWNNIGNKGIISLSESLKLNESLISIWLDFNSISFVGGKSLHESLSFNSSLSEIYLDENHISKKIFNDINSLVQENKENPKKAKERVENNLKNCEEIKKIKFSSIIMVKIYLF